MTSSGFNLVSCAFLALVVTVLAILVLRPVAITLNLVDRPGGRKTHHGEVPLIGGLAIFIGLVAGLAFVTPGSLDVPPLLGIFALMAVTGLFDDRFSLSCWMRLVVHAVAGIVLVVTTDSVVRTLGDPFAIGPIWLSATASVLFTILMITGAVNAFNMLDGMDGLAGIVAVISLAGLAGLAALSGQGGVEVALCAVLAAATVGFMIFNVPVQSNRERRCFMGDAGSTLIGVAVAWLCARISQMPLQGAAHPTTVLWMVALPTYELFWSVIRRALHGHSPLHADAGHFHHMLTQGGLNVRAAFVGFLLLDAALVGTGFLLNALQVPDALSFALLAAVGVLVVRSMYLVRLVVRWLPPAARRHPGGTSLLDI